MVEEEEEAEAAVEVVVEVVVEAVEEAAVETVEAVEIKEEAVAVEGQVAADKPSLTATVNTSRSALQERTVVVM